MFMTIWNKAHHCRVVEVGLHDDHIIYALLLQQWHLPELVVHRSHPSCPGCVGFHPPKSSFYPMRRQSSTLSWAHILFNYFIKISTYKSQLLWRESCTWKRQLLSVRSKQEKCGCFDQSIVVERTNFLSVHTHTHRQNVLSRLYNVWF